eukprot:jgi/Mesvir1/19043/Mv12805-RA.1
MAAYPSEFLSIEGIEAWEHAQAELDREKIATMASQTLVLHRQQKCRQQGGLPNKPTSNRNLQDAGHALAGLEFAGQMASAVTNAGLRKTHGAATCLAAHARFVAVGTDNGCVLVARNVDETTGRVPPEDASSKSTNDPRPFILGTAGTPDGSVTSLGFNPMGDWLASGYSTGAVNLWDLQRGSLLKGGIGAHHTAVIQLAFVPSPPQRANRVVGVAAPLAWLLTCDCGGTVLLHSLVTMPLMRRITAQHTAVLEGSPAGGGATSVLALATLTVIADPRHLIPLALQQHLSSLDGQASGQARSSDASAHAADAGAAAQAAKTSGRSLFPLLLPGVPDAGTTGGGSGTGGSSSGTGGGSGATAPAQDVGDVLAGAGIFALATWQSLIVARLFPEMEVLLRLPRDHLQGANCMAYLAWQPTAFLPASFMTQSAQSAPRNQQQSQQQRTQLHPQQPRAGGQSSHPSSEPASAASSAASSPSFAALASATSTLAPPPGGQGPRHRPSSVSLASAQSSPPAARQGDANAAGGVTGASGGLAALESPLMIGREVLLAVAQGRVVQVLSIEVTFASTASAGVTNALLGKQAAGTGARGGAGGSSGGGGGSAGCPPLEVTPRVRASWPLDADAAGVAWVSQPCSLLAVATVQEEILFFLCPGRSLGSAGSRAWNQRGSAGVSNSAGAMADSGAVASAGGTASASSGRSRGDVGAVAQAVQQQQQQEEEEVVDGGIQPLVRIGIGVQAHPSGGPGFSPGAGLGSLAHHDWLRNSYGTPERAFHGAVAVKGLGPDLLCLGGSCLQLVRLRGWRERLHAMASGAEWMEALAFGLDVFNGAALPPPYGYLAGSPMAGDGHPTPNSDGVPTRIGGGGQGQLIGGSWATEVRPRLHQGPWSEHDHRGEGGAAASASGSGGGGEVGGDGLQGTFINARGMVLPGVVDTAAILVLWPRVRADVRPVLVSLLRRYLEWVVEAAEREAMSEAMRRSERMAARERQVAVGGGSKVGSSGAHVAADRAHGQGMSRGETREGAGDGVAAGLGTGGSSVGLGDEAAGDGASKDEVGEDRGDHRDAGSGAGGAGCGGGGGGGPASVKEEEEEEEEEDIVELIRARFALASQASIEFCLSLGEAGLLFEDVYPLMSSAGQRDTFVGHLEPYVLSDQLVCMPPEIMQALVGLYSRGGPGGVGPFAPHPGLSGAGVRGGGGGARPGVNMLERVERCVLHMDIASLDFNQVLPLCLRHGLYSALAYLFNVGMGDYVTPLAEMYQAARRKAAAAGGGRASGQRTQAAAAAAAAGGPAAAAVTGGVATAPTRTDMGLSQAPAVHGLPPTPRNEGEAFLVYKLLVYLRFSFQGRPFPPGVPVSHLGAGGRGSANWRARCADLLTYLLGEDVGEGGGGHGGTRGRLGDGSGTRGLWRQFGGVSSMSHFVAEDAGAMLHFVAAVLLAPGSARLSPAALVRLLEYLALGPPAPEDSDRAEREELMVAVMEGSSRDALDLPWCAALTERARFCKACAMLLSWQGRRCDALACLLEDTGRTAEVYAYIRGVFAQAEREGTSQDRPIGTDTAGAASTREGISAFKQAVISHLPTLMARDGRGALRLVLRCLAREADALVRQLGSTPRLQYAILHGIMAAHLGGKQQPPALSQQPPPEALSQQAEGWQQKARSGEHRVPNDEGDTEGSLVELLASSGVVVTEAMAELYVERLCEYDPGRVLPFLASGEGYHVERCLALCTKHGVTDGSVYLLEKMGDLAGALALVLRDLEAHLAAFASAVHAAKGRASLRVSPQRAALALLTQSLESGIHLCRRSAHRLPSADYEELWFQLVDTLVLALRRAKGASLGGSGALFSAPGTAPLGSRQQQPVTASRDGSQRGQGHAVVAVDSNKGAVVVSGKDKGAVSGEVGAQVATMEVSGGEVVGDWGRLQQRRAGGVLHRTLTSLLGDVMTSATECLPLQAVLRKLLAEHGRDELGDFRASILGMLASCGYEASILATAMSATADDAYRSVRQLQALHRGAMAIRAATCLACGMDMFTRAVAAKQSGADKEPGVASESGGGTSGQGRGLDGTLSSQGGDKPPGAGAAEGHKDSAKVVLFACGHGYHTACCAAQQKGATAKALSCRKCQASSGDAPQLGLSRWPPRVPRYVVAYM